MNYLHISHVIAIHNEVIKETGGTPEIRDVGLLESAIARPQATFAEKRIFIQTFFQKQVLLDTLLFLTILLSMVINVLVTWP